MQEGLHQPGRGAAPRAPAHMAALLALAVLAAGVLVYLVDRPAGSASALPRQLHLSLGAPLFGAWAGSLPSFAHAFGFSTLSALLLPRRRLALAGACVFWAAVDAAFEWCQRPELAQPIATWLRQLHAGWPSEATAAYLVHGRFDPLDLLAGALGAAAAFGVLQFGLKRESRT